MTERGGKESEKTAGSASSAQPREERLAAALRENLRRRKAQARGRKPTADDGRGKG